MKVLAAHVPLLANFKILFIFFTSFLFTFLVQILKFLMSLCLMLMVMLKGWL